MAKFKEAQDGNNVIFEKAACFFKDGKYEESKTCYKQLLITDENNARALHGLGVIAYHQNDIELAFKYLERSYNIEPNYSTAYCSLGKIQKDLGCLLAARNSYQKALEINPSSPEILCALGTIYKDLNQYELSEEHFISSLTIDDLSSLSHCECGCLYVKIKQYDNAITHFIKAFEIQPDYAEAYAQLAVLYVLQGRQLEANNYLKIGMECRPNSLILRTFTVFTMNYLPGVTPAEIFTLSTDWARRAIDSMSQIIPIYKNLPDADKVLRIGFVSPDFRRHPVGYFVQSFMMLHDIEQFEVVCYSDVKGEDELTELLIASVEKWRRVYGVKDDKLAEMIRRDGIDILVDLAGHTKDCRLNAFVLKPAPIQVTWAGYVGTTGLSTIDYLISDKYQSPEGAEEYTVERIIRMPDDYISYSPPDYAPDVSPLPALKNGYVTFGCFNNLAKISDVAILLWSKILNNVKNSKIFIKNPSFSDRSTVERFISIFEANGISAGRIITEGQSAHPEMLEKYSLVDIQLDTMPYSGGLTTLESIWMGVPVVTLPGELFSSRHSLSHLMNMGLSELVASTKEEYISIACLLAGDLTKLSEMRKNMRNQMASSPVCDGFEFTANIQNAFRKIWCEWCEKSVTEVLIDEDEDLSEQAFLGDHISYNDQGNRYSDEGDFDAAIKCYREALDIKPGYVEAYYNMGLVWYKTGNLEEAIRLFNLVLLLSPDFAEAYTNLSNLYTESGRLSDALSICQQAIINLPEYDIAYCDLGNILIKLDQSEEALVAFRKALELNPQNSMAKNLIVLLSSKVIDQ